MLRHILRVLLALMFIGGGVNHFVNPGFYLPMMPDYIPAHDVMVALSGVTELIAGVLLLVPRTQRVGAALIVAHLVVFMTVHVWMVQHPERYPDIPVAALWIRIVLQLVLIAWAGWFVRSATPRPR